MILALGSADFGDGCGAFSIPVLRTACLHGHKCHAFRWAGSAMLAGHGFEVVQNCGHVRAGGLASCVATSTSASRTACLHGAMCKVPRWTGSSVLAGHGRRRWRMKCAWCRIGWARLASHGALSSPALWSACFHEDTCQACRWTGSSVPAGHGSRRWRMD